MIEVAINFKNVEIAHIGKSGRERTYDNSCHHYGTETDNKYTELSGNLCCYLSPFSLNASTQFIEHSDIGLSPGNCQSDHPIGVISNIEIMNRF